MWDGPDADVGLARPEAVAARCGVSHTSIYALFVTYTMVWSVHIHEVNRGDDVSQDGESA